MHTEMWLNDATQTNLKTLVSRKLRIVEPGTGRLTGEDSGVGRIAEPREIFEKAVSVLGGILSGKRVVVTAGGTREPIDIARFVGNYSSGKQGLAFARSAQRMGADVILIAANLEEDNAKGLDVLRVSTAQELENAVKANVLNCDIFIMAAAVADYRPKDSTSTKIKRLEVGEELELKLVMNSDVLASAVKEIKERGSRTITLGFAAESSADLEELALQKLKTKGCDYIFANDISGGAVFGRDTTSALLVSSEKSLPYSGSKEQVAELVLTEIASNMGEL
jgi:phosphopantothenoylcysteine decarboxylase/phosphopantothenate--cysteine ligase